jgi:hypothetical protein
MVWLALDAINQIQLGLLVDGQNNPHNTVAFGFRSCFAPLNTALGVRGKSPVTDTLFHAIDPRDWMFCHNIKLSAGRLTAVSLVRAAVPDWGGMRSPYEAFTREAEKEDFFEAVRAGGFPAALPRKGALFLFASAEDAAAANASWWQGQRVILSAQIVQASRVGAFDARKLDASREGWEAAARSYWAGETTEQPRIEVLVDGIVQLRGWEPFAQLMRPGE